MASEELTLTAVLIPSELKTRLVVTRIDEAEEKRVNHGSVVSSLK